MNSVLPETVAGWLRWVVVVAVVAAVARSSVRVATKGTRDADLIDLVIVAILLGGIGYQVLREFFGASRNPPDMREEDD